MRQNINQGALMGPAQKQARVALLQPLGVVASKRTFFVDCVHHGPSQREQRETRVRRRKVGQIRNWLLEQGLLAS